MNINTRYSGKNSRYSTEAPQVELVLSFKYDSCGWAANYDTVAANDVYILFDLR